MSPSNYIFRMFGSSPIRPLQKHMAKVSDCVSELVPLFEAVLANDFEGVKAAQERVVRGEHDADRLKKDLRLNLPRGLLMPVSRADLLDVLLMQDNIANKAKDIAGLILGRKMTFPEPMGERFLEYVRRNLDAVEQAHKAINELDELVETGFRGGEVELVEKMLKMLDEIESNTDAIQVELRGKLFDMEHELPPVDVMFLYRIIEWIGDLGDLSQRVGSRLQLMLAH